MKYVKETDSTAISKIQYDTDTQILVVTFIRGAEYEYYDIPYETYAEFCKAESVGKYFNNVIKKCG